jgi:hypothetical protein
MPPDRVIETWADVGRHGALLERAMSAEALGNGSGARNRDELRADRHRPLAFRDVTCDVDARRMRGAKDYGGMNVAPFVHRENSPIVRVDRNVDIGDGRPPAGIGEETVVGRQIDEAANPVVLCCQAGTNERRCACPEALRSCREIAEHARPVEIAGAHLRSRGRDIRSAGLGGSARPGSTGCEQSAQEKQRPHQEESQISL